MIEAALGIIRYGFALLFGVAVTVSFVGIERTRKNILATCYFCLTFLLVQSACWWFFGMELTSKLYPLIIHLPLIVFIAMYLKRPWPISVVSVLSAYLCCQVPSWIGGVAGSIFGSELMNHISYLVAVFLVFYFLQKYVAKSVLRLMEKSTLSCLFFGAVPLFYYLFDYGTTVYTDLLYSGARVAVQFMPSVVSVFYFVFVILYNGETQKQARAQRERDMLTVQLQHARTEFESLQKMQQSAAAYRHDIRHHLTLMQGLASEGSLEKIKTYLMAAQSDIDAITPIRFCENETVNLILSTFSAKAKQAGISVKADAKLPKVISLSDTELCSLLSNGLENAITAASSCPDSGNRTVTVKSTVHKGKLLISIENPYAKPVKTKDGLPLSSQAGHGYGTRSIVSIVEGHGGQAIFNADYGVFTLKIMLPLEEQVH